MLHPVTEKLLDQLSSVLNVPPVVIFYGPKSEEKQAFALQWIEGQVNPDHHERLKNRIFNQVHPDVQLFYADSAEQYSMGLIHQWIREAGLPPFELSKKWLIIAEGEKLTSLHHHALLKTLEEAAPFVRFILFVDSLTTLPETIRSRAIKVPFYPLSKQQLEKKLEQDVTYQGRTGYLSGLVQGSLHFLPLVEALWEKQYFQSLHHIFFSIMTGLKADVLEELDQMDALFQEERFSKRDEDILEISFLYLLECVKKIGEKQPEIFGHIPRFFEKKEEAMQALKRHSKLKTALEYLVISLKMS